MTDYPPIMWSFNRLFEWAMSVALCFIGIYIWAVPEAMMSSRMNPILNIFPLPALTVSYLVVGIVRVVALILAIQHGPWPCTLRAIGAALSGINWLQMGVALAITAYTRDLITSPTSWLYMILAAGEFVSVYRARIDARVFELR